MQNIFSLSTNKFITEPEAKKHLTQSIQQFLDLYLYFLYTLLQVAEYVETDADLKANKLLPEAQDQEVNAKLLQNSFVIFLQEHEEFQHFIEKNKLQQYQEQHVIRSLYKALNKNEEYIAYLNNILSDKQEDFAVAKLMLVKLIAKSDVFKKNVEDHFINFDDDFYEVKKIANQQIKRAIKSNSFEQMVYKKDNYFKELQQFAVTLFEKTLDHSDFFEEQMSSYLKNWDTKRLAIIDLILIKMALCELQFFKEIPVKVTINEYIEISKQYSTPKSKDFINGILDKMMKDLQQSGKINKTGRGLNE